MSNNKFILMLIVVVFSASGILALRLALDSGTDTKTRTGAVLDKFATNNGSLPDKVSSLFTLSSLKVSSFFQGSKSGSVVFFDKDTGRIMETEIAKTNETQITPAMPGYVSSLWSGDGKKAAVLSNSREGTTWSIYDIPSQKSSVLPKGTQSVIFSPQGNQIAYFQTGDKESGIFISETDGTIAKKLLSTRAGEAELYWPESSHIYALIKEPKSAYASIMSIGMDGQLEKIMPEKRNIRISWSGDGKKALISYSTSVGLPELSYYDLTAKSSAPIALATFASKCSWFSGSQSALCAVPTEKVTSEGLTVPDDIVQINFPDMKQSVVYTRTAKDVPVSVSRPKVMGLEGYLVFVNTIDGLLYSIGL